MTQCLHQIIKGYRLPDYLRPKGVGDCYTCIPSEDNKKCLAYCPVSFKYIEVKDGKLEGIDKLVNDQEGEGE